MPFTSQLLEFDESCSSTVSFLKYKYIYERIVNFKMCHESHNYYLIGHQITMLIHCFPMMSCFDIKPVVLYW